MKSDLHILSGLFLILIEVYFIVKGFRNEEMVAESKQSLQSQKNKAVYYMIVEPWKTKFCWGGIIQLILLFIIILLQIID